MDELQQARVEIDAVDQEMARLFERRMAACRQVAQYKKERGLPILDANREAAVIERGRCVAMRWPTGAPKAIALAPVLNSAGAKVSTNEA